MISSLRFGVRRTVFLGPVLAALLLGTGCDRNSVRAYRAPKDTRPAAPPGPPADSAHPPGPPALSWKLPAGWQELPPGQMRVGNFTVAGPDGQKAQVTIVPLGGMGGGDLENVNRWRSQVSLPRIDQAEMAKLTERVAVGSLEGQLFDFAGIPPEEDRPARLLAAVLHREGTAWFFKMLGDDALVAAQKPAFIAFLNTVRFDTAGASAAPAPAAAGNEPLPASHPPIPGQPAQAPGGGAPGRPAWTVPAGWEEQSPGPMQMARFATGGTGGKAEVSVAVLPGDGGGALMNVNRWRRQLELGAISEAELAKAIERLEIPGATAYLVDLAADTGQRRMIAAAVTRGETTWFYKLTGDSTPVAQARESFVGFVQSSK